MLRRFGVIALAVAVGGLLGVLREPAGHAHGSVAGVRWQDTSGKKDKDKKDYGCVVEATPVAFGEYNPLDPTPARTIGNITYRCGKDLGTEKKKIKEIRIVIDRGNGPSFDRETTSGSLAALRYNLYLDPTTNLVWGDGTGGTSVYEDSKVTDNQSVVVPVYGSVHAEQDVVSGTYLDRVTVTIEILK